MVLKVRPAGTGNIQGRPDSGSARVWGYTVYWGIEFRKLYSILCVNLGIRIHSQLIYRIKYTVVFLNFGILHEF